MTARRRLTRAPLLVLAAIWFLQLGNAFARTWFDATGPLGGAALRLTIGAALLLVFTRPRVRTWTRASWLGVLLLGIALGSMNTSIYLAIDRIPFGVAVTIEFLGPLAVAIVQTRRRVDALWALLAFVGVAMLGGGVGGAQLDAVGVAFAALAAYCWAGYILATANLSRRVEGTEGLAVAACVAALLVLPLGAPDAAGAVADRPNVLAAFVLVAALTSALPYALEYRALRELSTRVFGVLMSLEPAVAAVAGWLVLGQSLRPVELLALGCVTAASLGALGTARQDEVSVPLAT